MAFSKKHYICLTGGASSLLFHFPLSVLHTADIELPLTALAKPYDVVISSTPSDEEISSFIKSKSKVIQGTVLKQASLVSPKIIWGGGGAIAHLPPPPPPPTLLPPGNKGM